MRDGPRLAVVQGDLWGAERPSPASAWVDNRRTPASRKSAEEMVRSVVSILGGDPDHPGRVRWDTITREHVKRFRAELLERYSPRTGQVYMSALKCIVKEAVRAGQMTYEAWDAAFAGLTVGGESIPRGRALKTPEIGKVLKAAAKVRASWRGVPQAEREWRAARDRALISLMVRTGPRRFEVVNLKLSDYRQAERLIVFRAGKGRRDGALRVGAQCAEHLKAWLKVRGLKPGPLFCHMDMRPIAKKTLWHMLRVRAKQAGVEAFSPHDLRYTFGTTLLRRKVDVFLVKRAMRHKRLETTLRYDRREDEEAWAEVDRLDRDLPS